MLFTIQRNEPVGYPWAKPAMPRLTGVSTARRKAPSRKPTINAARQPFAFKRLNAKGCLAALIVGFLLGAFRLAVDTPVSLGMAGFAQGYPTGSFLWIVNNIYFQYYSLFIFVVSCLTMIVVSSATAAPEAAQVTNLTFGTVTAESREQSRASWNRWDVINSGIVLGLILLAYLYFTG